MCDGSASSLIAKEMWDNQDEKWFSKNELDYWIHVNTEYSKKWPNITKKKDALPEHEEFHPDKFPDGKKDLFDENPGDGD